MACSVVTGSLVVILCYMTAICIIFLLAHVVRKDEYQTVEEDLRSLMEIFSLLRGT